MNPESSAKIVLAVTRSQAKMYEYQVPEEDHIEITVNPSDLFDLTISILGNLSSSYDTNANFAQESTITFSAHFFDAYINSRLNPYFDPYLFLIGSAAYYLSDMPGNAAVLAKMVPESFDLGANEMDEFLRLLLMYKIDLFAISGTKNLYKEELQSLVIHLKRFFNTGEERQSIVQVLDSLKAKAYAGGSDRELLFTDIIRAVIIRMIKYSVWSCLPDFSGIPINKWREAIKKETFIRELWPSQILLGQKDVLSGSSAIVQMPTSAGKTRAVELIIRSAFLSGRASLALIIAPYRALCHEIHSSLLRQFNNEEIEVEVASDILQEDVIFTDKQQILILTPEKLEFLLRHDAELVHRFELIIYDEGHLFDDPSRGVAYELLLTSLKLSIPSNAQIVLISAVVENSEDILHWLVKNSGQVVQGTSLLPTYRTIAFSSWRTRQGRLEFISPDDPTKREFYVPRIIEQTKLQRQTGETKIRYFPEKGQSKDIALYLGLKLHINGSVAIFSGRKDTAFNTLSRATEIFDRGIQLAPPSEECNEAELDRLIYQHTCHFGDESAYLKAACLGIFIHHGTTPHGLRLAIEYALQQDYIRFVICTSTLAQGVNIPLRYIILTSLQQGPNRIKHQDFYNLIGRAGRAGMYTEGTVIFANPSIYDTRSSRRDRWRWKNVIELLSPSENVPCSSQILTLFNPIKDNYGNEFLQLKSFQLCRLFFLNKEKFSRLPKNIYQKYKSSRSLDLIKLHTQFEIISEILKSIEAFLLRFITIQKENITESVTELAENTLAFVQGNENNRDELVKLFLFIAEHIETTCNEATKRNVYSKTILTVQDCIKLEQYILDHKEEILEIKSSEEFFEAIYPVIKAFSNNKSIKSGEEAVIKKAGLVWIQGAPFHQVFKEIKGIKIGNRWATIDHTINLCEAGFGFQGSFIIGAFIELLPIVGINSPEFIKTVRFFQRQMKYGLPRASAVDVYELGLSDRCLAMEIASILTDNSGKFRLRTEMQRKKDQVEAIVNKYPKYFQLRLAEILQ